ncbi:MAG: DnaA/Hda family protein [Paracoccaceae bacterium]
MRRQLTFDLPARPALGRDDFFVSPSNSNAVTTVENWPGWPQGKLALVGPKGSGKTHLAHVWAAEAGGRVIAAADLAVADIAALGAGGARLAVEDVDRIAGNPAAEQALFHLHNLVLAEAGVLLLTGTAPPSQWPLSLPDLASRMQGTSVAQLAPPDDALLMAVLMKLFADRQLAVAPPVLEYLVTRMERSFDGAQGLVAALDHAALAERRAITRALAAQVLDNGVEGTA